MENDDLRVAPPGEGETFERQNPAMGEHQAVCCQIHNLGHQEYQGKASLSPKCVIIFELDQKMEGGKVDGKPFVISQEFPMYLSKDSKLRTFLGSWRGKPFTDEECDNFTLRKLLNKPATLIVIHNTKDGKTYANIASAVPPKAGVIAIPVTYTETPKWITAKQAKQLRPPEIKKAAPKPEGQNMPPQPEDDLPF